MSWYGVTPCPRGDNPVPAGGVVGAASAGSTVCCKAPSSWNAERIPGSNVRCWDSDKPPERTASQSGSGRRGSRSHQSSCHPFLVAASKHPPLSKTAATSRTAGHWNSEELECVPDEWTGPRDPNPFSPRSAHEDVAGRVRSSGCHRPPRRIRPGPSPAAPSSAGPDRRDLGSAARGSARPSDCAVG